MSDAPDYLRTCWCDGATYEDDDGVLRCWDCAALVQQTSERGGVA